MCSADHSALAHSNVSKSVTESCLFLTCMQCDSTDIPFIKDQLASNRNENHCGSSISDTCTLCLYLSLVQLPRNEYLQCFYHCKLRQHVPLWWWGDWESFFYIEKNLLDYHLVKLLSLPFRCIKWRCFFSVCWGIHCKSSSLFMKYFPCRLNPKFPLFNFNVFYSWCISWCCM